MSSDPQRLLEAGSGAPDELRELLRRGQQDVPSSAELGRLETKLGAILAMPPGAVPAPPPGAGSELAAASSGLKAAGAALIVAAVIGAGAIVALRSWPTAPSSPPRPQISESPSLPEMRPQTPPPTARAEPGIEPPAARETPSEPRPAQVAPSGPGGPSEVELLEQARAALASDPGRALSLAQEHKRRFAKGALAQEREVIAIEALARLGEREQARKRAKEFEERFPNSAHRRKVGASAPAK